VNRAEKRLEIVYGSSLVGADLERSDLRGLDLRGANLTNANLRAADLSRCDLRGATLVKADLSRGCLHLTNFEGANLTSADLTMSYGRAANFSRATCCLVSFRYAQLKNAWFIETDLYGADFVNALLLGTKFDGADLDGVKNMDRAIFTWWWSPIGTNKISYEPIPGWIRLDESITGDHSVRENASRERVEDAVERSWDHLR